MKAAGDAVVEGKRFVADLREADTALRRRVVDHLSGVVYGCGATMAVVGDMAVAGVPSGEEFTDEDRQRVEALLCGS